MPQKSKIQEKPKTHSKKAETSSYERILISKSLYFSLFNVFFFSTKYPIIFGKVADQRHCGLARIKDHILYICKMVAALHSRESHIPGLKLTNKVDKHRAMPAYVLGFPPSGMVLPPPAGDTGQRIPCFDSCQLITTLMCH